MSATRLSWRTTTAIRVFGLAVATGSLLSGPDASTAAPLLTALALIVAVAALTDRVATSQHAMWLTIGEAVLVAIVLGSVPAPLGPIAFLAVPPVIAGVRHGLVSVVNVTILTGLTAVASLAVGNTPDPATRSAAVVTWMAMGMGIGLLASWQSRSTRDLVARQAPYAAAHQLMARLHQLASAGNLGLDSTSLAADLDRTMRRETGAARCGVFLADADARLRPLVPEADSDRLAQEIVTPPADRTPGAAVVQLRGARQVLGYCVLTGVPRWSNELEQRAHEVADEFAVRLDTAVLFDEIRHIATAEERNRIARDMHDGVAQEMVALGYVVDELESVSRETETLQLAAHLRSEITRVVTELRHSIFDLRHHVVGQDLTTALTDYVQEVSRDTGLRVHLVLDSTRTVLPARTQDELMRIAQEAIANVRRHARATNLWVTLVCDRGNLRLEILDDGVGDAGPRERHWGLQTMRERAAGIGADLTIESRAGGGTAVRLLTTPHTTTRGRAPHEHHSPAHR